MSLNSSPLKPKKTYRYGRWEETVETDNYHSQQNSPSALCEDEKKMKMKIFLKIQSRAESRIESGLEP